MPNTSHQFRDRFQQFSGFQQLNPGTNDGSRRESAGGRGANVKLKEFQQLPSPDFGKGHSFIGARGWREHHDRRGCHRRLRHQTNQAGSATEGDGTYLRCRARGRNLQTTEMNCLNGGGQQEDGDAGHGQPCRPVRCSVLDIHSSNQLSYTLDAATLS
jgi:hypothetical protein